MTTNPNNYVGVSATIVGYAASDPQNPPYDKEGTRGVKEFSIPINEGYMKDGEFVQTGTSWYTYTAGGSGVDLISHIRKGDKVRIDDAKLETREYETKTGEKKLGLGLRFGNVTVLESVQGSPTDTTDDDLPW